MERQQVMDPFEPGVLAHGWEREFSERGFVALPAALTTAAATALADEVLSAAGANMRGHRAICGPIADALIDAPLVRTALGAVFGGTYELCHTTYHVKPRGAKGQEALHQDFAFGPAPWSLRGCQHSYISVFYYPLGARLRLVPGSHRVDPFSEELQGVANSAIKDEGAALRRPVDQSTLPQVFATEYGLGVESIVLPPRSAVLLNCKTWHAGDAHLPSDSPHRVFRNYVYKTAGSEPHELTQVIPDAWFWQSSAHRQMLFGRRPGVRDSNAVAEQEAGIAVARTWADVSTHFHTEQNFLLEGDCSLASAATLNGFRKTRTQGP
eukprot:COSAG05_NODE_1284_length_5281_cov_19.439599_7_plen_323_part_01